MAAEASSLPLAYFAESDEQRSVLKPLADQTKSESIDESSHDPDRRDSSPGVYRFRKRDKAMYTAKKLLRKVSVDGHL